MGSAGFEKFVQGRRAEDMPQITSRICGVCPMAHHMAATKALDDLYQVDPPAAGQIYRACTAFDAANYTLQRLAALGGEIRSVHQP
jgi:coenzyme F420-reducing hydrogenase alpha subunit